jgi:hypothetical protein
MCPLFSLTVANQSERMDETMDIGQLGALCFMDAMTAPEILGFCRRLKRMR